MKAVEKIQQRWDQSLEKLNDYLDTRSLRERIMVIFTGIFVLVAAVGSAL